MDDVSLGVGFDFEELVSARVYLVGERRCSG